MKILIVIALKQEIDIDINNLKLNNNEIDICYCGVGKVNASCHLTQFLIKKHYDLVLNIGSCGSLNEKFLIGDIVLVNRFYYLDVDLTFFGYQFGQLPNTPVYYQTANYSHYLTKFHDLKLKEGNIGTCDSFINIDNINQFQINQDISLIDMESTALKQVCEIFKVPFVAFKMISDYVFKKDQNWKKSVVINQNNLYSILLKILQRI